ncbi:UNVERIFIED_CONTAM: hypothetical protein HDU68_004542 [Siphonaria sp. JEL0065]|nr:hypothetical protein HDU68_004542 [Siphonaria sp. JEL0065]
MAACSGQPYGIDNIVVQIHPTLMANTDITFIQAFSFVLVTQFLGYGFAGLTRRFLFAQPPCALGSHVSPRYFYDKTQNYNINMTAYNNVAPIHLCSNFALCYASSFLTVTAALIHVALWYGKDIYRQAMSALRQDRDEVDGLDKHVKMMEAYPDIQTGLS